MAEKLSDITKTEALIMILLLLLTGTTLAFGMEFVAGFGLGVTFSVFMDIGPWSSRGESL